MTEAQLWFEKARKWRALARTAEDAWATGQLLLLAVQAEKLAFDAQLSPNQATQIIDPKPDRFKRVFIL